MRLRYTLFALLLLIGALLIVQQDSTTVAQDNSCPVLVQSALEQMGDNCGSLGRNNACYGYTQVTSTFFDSTPLDFFSQPSDRAELAQIETISTAPLDLDLDQWGIAVMNVQANVPGALPGQSVVFMMMGDTEVENAVPADETLPLVDMVDVTTTAETRVASLPATNANTLTLLPAGAILQAEGVSDDGAWLRVYSDQGLGWVMLNAIDDSVDLTGLPTVTAESRPAMQSFQLRTAFNDVLCNEAPSLLAIQSPEGLKVDLTANGVHVRMGSLIMLRVVSPGDALQIITIEGDVVLDPDTDLETVLEPGFSTLRCLDAEGNVGLDCEWTVPQPLTAEELAFAQTVLLAYQQFGENNGSPLEVNGQQVRVIDTDACPVGAAVEYTVRPGDSLYAISLQYNTNVSAIQFNNSIEGTTILPGQKLNIICGAQGPTALPSLGTPIIVNDGPPPPPAIDCAGFEATSPLNGLPYGPTTFYWNAPNTEVDEYRVNVSGESGSASFTTGGENLNLTGDLSVNNVGYGFSFTWNVEALVDGEPVCSTPGATMFREAPPPLPKDDDDDSEPISTPTPYETEEPWETEEPSFEDA